PFPLWTIRVPDLVVPQVPCVWQNQLVSSLPRARRDDPGDGDVAGLWLCGEPNERGRPGPPEGLKRAKHDDSSAELLGVHRSVDALIGDHYFYAISGRRRRTDQESTVRIHEQRAD